MTTILCISVLLNVILSIACFCLYKRYYPKSFTMRERAWGIGENWWVVQHPSGRLIGLYTAKGERFPNIVKGSFHPTTDDNGANRVRLDLYVNYAESEADMKVKIWEHEMKQGESKQTLTTFLNIE